jgi:hypothetical protein
MSFPGLFPASCYLSCINFFLLFANISQESGIFNDKAITYLTEYLDTVGQQVLDKYQSDIGDYDLALITPEKADQKV